MLPTVFSMRTFCNIFYNHTIYNMDVTQPSNENSLTMAIAFANLSKVSLVSKGNRQRCTAHKM